MTDTSRDGLSLRPFRALRPAVDAARLSRLLCPPYDVIDEGERARLLAADPDNAVGVILPEAADDGDPYLQAAQRLDNAVARGLLATDGEPALYVYEMHVRPSTRRTVPRRRTGWPRGVQREGHRRRMRGKSVAGRVLREAGRRNWSRQ